MTSSITPNPGIHNMPALDSGAWTLPDWAQLQAWGNTLVTQIEQAIAFALLNVSVLGVKPFVALQTFGTETLGAVSQLEQLIAGVGGAAMSDVIALLNKIQQLIDKLFNGLGVPGSGFSIGGLEAAFQQALSGLQSSFVNAFDGGANALNAIIFNNDGGAQVTFSPHLTAPLSVIIHHLDGGATGLHDLIFNNDGGVIISDVATAGAGLMSAVDGGAMSLAQTVQNDFAAGVATAQQITGGIESSIHNAFGGFIAGLHDAFTGPTTGPAPTTPIQVSQTTAAAAALQQRLATIGNGAEEQVDVEFSGYSNGALPAVFTAIGSGSGMSISGGHLVFSGAGGSAFYNAATFLTDYQTASGSWSSGTAATLTARYNNANSSSVNAQFGTGAWQLNATNSGFVWAVNLADTFTPGAEYVLVCGDPATLSPYRFQILKNGTPLTITSSAIGPYSTQVGQIYLDDASHLSAVGGSNREAALGGASVSMSYFKFQDTIQSSPSVLVATSESTASTTYTDLATISDEVVVNIGTSGLAQVNIVSQFSNTVANGQSSVSFALSGANTQAASDTFGIFTPCTASHTVQFGGSFLLPDLAPGLTVFKMKYAAQSGTTATFTNRRISVVAL